MTSILDLLIQGVNIAVIIGMVAITGWVFFLYFSSMVLGIREMFGGKPAFDEPVATQALAGTGSKPI